MNFCYFPSKINEIDLNLISRAWNMEKRHGDGGICRLDLCFDVEFLVNYQFWKYWIRATKTAKIWINLQILAM